MNKNHTHPNTLVELLCLRAQNKPDKPAYTFLKDGETEEISLTYAQLDRYVRTIAARLQSLLAPGERALLLYPSGLDYIAAFFACLYAGIVAVPSYPPRRNRPDARLQAIANDAQASVVLTTTEIWSDITSRLVQLPELKKLQWLVTDNLDLKELAKFWQPPDIHSDTLAFLQYTSGSTGKPKGVMVSHLNVLHNLEDIKQRMELTTNTVSVTWLPSFHDMGLIDGVIQPLYTGFVGIIMPPVSFLQKPIRWLQAISRYRVTHSGGPNFAYNFCLQKITKEQRKNIDLSSWCTAYNAAEPIRPDTIKRFVETFGPCGFHANVFYPCYGLAENTAGVSGGMVKNEPVYYAVNTEALGQETETFPTTYQAVKQLIGCGYAAVDSKILIVDPKSLTLCEPEQVGEIWIAGPCVAQGYWNKPEETKHTFQAYLADTNEGPFLRTGDLGFLKDGELFVTGRLKDLIIIRGRNYYPQDIELTVENSHTALNASSGAAFSVEKAGEERLVIVQEVQRTYLRHLDVDDVVGAIRQTVLEQHELSVDTVLLLKTGSIPKTSSGKIQRHACRDRFIANDLEVVGKWQQPIIDKIEVNDISCLRDDLPKQLDTEAIQKWLATKISQQVGIAPNQIDIRQPFTTYGIDSVIAVSLSGELANWLERQLSPTLIYDYPTIETLAKYLTDETDFCPPLLQRGVEGDWKTVHTEPIAIIGLGCRFPKAKNPNEFWQLLKNGVDAITEIPKSRWDIKTFYEPTLVPGKMNTRWGGFLDDVDQFDPAFFNISPREAERMDPQQRLLLEVTWEALEHAALAIERLAGSQTGVFIGITNNDYSRLQSMYSTGLDAYSGTGNALSIAANRLSYLLDLQGPSWVVDTACSSSLVSVHQACHSLRQGECDLALAGGVNLILSPDSTITFSAAQMLSADGRCKTYDAEADGYVRGEGCGIIVLKPLSKALKDKDNILALIRGSAVNQDGRSNGLTAPNGPAQQAVIRQALANAGVMASEISYVETHGSGTPLGDPIEVNALKEVVLSDRSKDKPCYMGSVKTNLGHLEAAAGIAGLIKVILALQHQEIPPHLHLNQLNPYIDITNTPLSIPTACQSWPRSKERRLAGISSFGFGGTNAHLILEEAPSKQTSDVSKTSEVFTNERSQHLLTLSAQDEPALRALAKAYANYLQSHPQSALADVCFTANTGRSHFAHRLAVVANSSEQLQKQLSAFAVGDATSGLVTGQVQGSKPPKIAFLFTGQGSQYVGMGRELYETQPLFRQTLEHCDNILRPYLEKPLLEVLYQESDVQEERKILSSPNRHFSLNETAYTQPALFALEYALVELWKSWGIEPNVVMGHSVGEYVAACVAGVFSLEQGLKLISERARLMQSLPVKGEMLTALTVEAQVIAACQPYSQEISIAAINDPNQIVISGRHEAIQAVRQTLEAQEVIIHPLTVSQGSHSPLMKPMLPAFQEIAATINYSSPQREMISNVTGKLATNEITTPEYWCRHAYQPVRFRDGMETLHQLGTEVFVEIGPKPTLLGMGHQCLPSEVGVWLPSLRQWQSNWQQLLQSLAQLYVQGVPVDWSSFDHNYPRHRLHLPTYPFQRQRYWIREIATGSTNHFARLPNSICSQPSHPLLGHQFDLAGTPEIHFETQLSQHAPAYLAHHHVDQFAIVPVAAYIEMGLAAGASIVKSGQPVLIKEIAIEQPLILPEDKTVTVQLLVSPTENKRYKFQIFSQTRASSPWTRHATGQMVVGDRNLAGSGLDLAQLQVQCAQKISVEQHYQHCQKLGLHYGASFQSLHQLFIGKNSALSKLYLPESLIFNADDYQFHPVLLNAGFQVFMASLPNSLLSSLDNETFLPVAIEQLQVYRHAEINLWCHVQLPQNLDFNQPILTANISFFEESGTPIAQIKGFTVKRTHRETLQHDLQTDLSEALYEVTWQVRQLENAEVFKTTVDSKPGSWLLLADKTGVGQALAKLLAEKGEFCWLAYAGSAYENQANKLWYLNPAHPTDFERWFSEAVVENMPALKGIVHLWSLDATDTSELTTDSLTQAQVLSCGSVLHFLQAQSKHPQETSPKLWLVTRNAVSVEQPLASLAVAQAPLWGLGKVMALEHPELWGGMIDLALQQEKKDNNFVQNEKNETIDLNEATKLLAEIFSQTKEDQIAYRNGQRYVARLVRSHPLKIPNEPFLMNHSQSSYLITGGLGGLGLKMAEWMVEQGVQYLVLTGRRGASSEAQEVLNRLEQTGTKILLAKADVSHQPDMANLFEEINAKMPPLRGIIHAAGVLEDGVLLQQNWARFSRVMAAKVQGSWNLHTLTQTIPLDFWICFSSGASLLGSPGQGNYAAANAFLDALVHLRRAMKLPGLSINWGGWAESGMAANLANRNQSRLANLGINTIVPEKGLQILSVLIGQIDMVQVGVLPINWSIFLQQFLAHQMPLFLSELAQITQSQSPVSLDFLEKLTEVPINKQRDYLITHLQSQLNKVLGVNPSQPIDLHKGFFDLGMDSLMAVELKNRLQTSLKCSLPSTLLFKYPTIEALTNYLASEVLSLEIQEPPTLSVESKPEHETSEAVLNKIKQLSEEALEELIETKFTQFTRSSESENNGG